MRAAAALLVLALLLRVAAIVLVDFTAVNDPADYVRHGLSIAAGEGYPPSDVATGPSALRPPVYPTLVGAAFAVSGDEVDAARLLNALLGTAVVALTGLMALRLWGRQAGLAALAIAAVCPPQLVVGATLLSETAFTALALGALLSVLGPGRGDLARPRRDRSPRSLRGAALAGLLVGLAALTRTNGLVLLLPLLLLVGRRPRHAAALLAAAAVVVVPWSVRNTLVLDAFVPLTTSDGYTLAGAYNEASRTDPRFPWAWRVATADPAIGALVEGHPRDGEVERNDRLGAAARDFVADHPAAPLVVTARNLGRWTHLGGAEFARVSAASDGLPRWTGTFAALGTIVLLLLAGLGLARGALRGTPRSLWLAPVLLLLSVAAIVSAVRYRAPAEPFLVLLAAFAVGRSDRVDRVALGRPFA